jgi:hypothetical protein
MQQEKHLPFAYCVGLSLFAFLFCAACPAIAGSPPPASGNFILRTDEQLTVEMIEASKKAKIFPWKLWSKPYIEGDLTCRQYQGEKVCLSSSSASQLNWNVQPSSLTPNLLDTNHEK